MPELMNKPFEMIKTLMFQTYDLELLVNRSRNDTTNFFYAHYYPKIISHWERIKEGCKSDAEKQALETILLNMEANKNKGETQTFTISNMIDDIWYWCRALTKEYALNYAKYIQDLGEERREMKKKRGY